ncbi:MAG: N-methyl-L-tryptophan oxidase [Anaerolineae bacterium]
MNRHYDVIVLGGGAIGAATAYSLVQRGKQVLLVERFSPGHVRGSSSGDGRVMRFNYSDTIYVELGLLAYPLWERLSHDSGKHLIKKTGMIEYGPVNCLPIRESQSNLQRYNLAHQWLSAADANRRFPQFHFSESRDILHQPDGTAIFATPAVMALWDLFVRLGGTTQINCQIEAISARHDGIELRDSRGDSWFGERLVMAAGPWMKPLGRLLELELPLSVTQEGVAYFASINDVDHRVGTMPILADYHTLEHPFFCLPQVDIPGVKTGRHGAGPIIEADAPQPASTAIVEAMADWVKRVFPHLDSTPFEVKTCMFTNTPDTHFIMDTHPQMPNIVIASTCSGHGFKFAPIIGELLAGLALDEKLPLELDTFSLARFNNSDGLPKRVGV